MKMEKEVKTTLWIEDAVRVRAFFNDFDGDIPKWKEAFYEIWRYQMTWSFVHEIEVHEVGQRRDGNYDLCTSLLVKPAYRKNVESMMGDLGYKNLHITEEPVGVVQTWDIDDEDAQMVSTIVTNW